MNVYLLTGLILIVAANYIQIAEEWIARGLTDTSYKAVLCLVTGPLFVCYGSWINGVMWPVYVFAVVSMAGLAMLALKSRDFIHSKLRTLG